VTLTGLEPEILYSCEVTSGKTTETNAGRGYAFRTLRPGFRGSQRTVFGRVVQDDGQPAGGVVVFLTVTKTTGQTSLPLSTMTDTTGGYDFNLANLKDTTATDHVFGFSVGDRVVVRAVAGGGVEGRVDTLRLSLEGFFQDFGVVTLRQMSTPTAPQARFTVTPDSGVAPLRVSLQDSSTGTITSRVWSFGDGQTSTEQNPTHTYTTPGRYTVTLTVTGPGGTSTITRLIVVTSTRPQLVRLNIRLAQAAGGAALINKQLALKAELEVVFAADGIDTDGKRVAMTPAYTVVGEIGTMTPAGKFTGGKKAGNRGSIVVSAEGVRDTITVVIVPNLLKRLAITPSVVRLTPGQQVTFTAEGFDAFDNSVGRVRPLWHTVGKIGTIQTITGVFTAGTTVGTGYVIAFTQNTFGDVQAGVSGSAKVVVEQELPTAYALAQNYPNPFNPETAIRYDLPDVAAIQLVVYDLAGRVIRTLVRGYQQPGVYTVVWDGRDDRGQDVASGIYFYRFEAFDRGVGATKRMVLVR
jgi:PKD repeat protein